MINTVEGADFVKLSCGDYGFVKLVGEDIIEVMPRNPTLRLTDGFRQLLSLRNACIAPVASPMRALFEGPARKAQRRSQALIQELREKPTIMTIEVPAFGTLPATSVRCLRPACAADDMYVEMLEATIEHIVLWIRSKGLSAEMLSDKRQYKASALEGVWANGDGKGFVLKLPSMYDGSKKYKRVESIEAALGVLNGVPLGAAPLEDEEQGQHDAGGEPEG